MRFLGILGGGLLTAFFIVLIMSGLHLGTHPACYSLPTVTTAYEPRVVKNIDVNNYNNAGEKMALYTQKPQRVLVVGNVLAESLAALGVDDCVQAAFTYTNRFFRPEPENATAYQALITKKGWPYQGVAGLNTEAVLMLQPDLIIAGQQPFSDKRIKGTHFWQSHGVHTFVSLNANSPYSYLHPESLENEYTFILGLGDIFDKRSEAEKLVAAMQDKILDIVHRTQGHAAAKVMIVERLGGMIAVYDDNKLAGDVCEKLGAVVPHTQQTIGWENLIAEDPDILFVIKSQGDAETAADVFRNMKALRHLKCVQNQRIYGIPLDYTYNSAVKTKTGIELFAHGLYPELFNDVN